MSLFAEIAEQYAGLEKVPLRVECHVADSVVAGSGLHLDSILSHPVVMQATQGAGLPNNHPYEPIPLPLDRLWTSPSGVPIWAATDMIPKGESARATRYWHRRAIRQDMTRRNIRTSEGQHKELRAPMPTINADVLIADVIGNADALTKLLAHVSAVGKKRTASGAVIKWVVYEIDTFTLYNERGQLRRPVPFQMLIKMGMDELNTPPQQIGVSPPYWHHATHLPAIPSGVRP